jgi:hypothetical protein
MAQIKVPAIVAVTGQPQPSLTTSKSAQKLLLANCQSSLTTQNNMQNGIV